MKAKRRALVGALGVLCWGAPAAAHHSFVVEYDVNRPLRLQGVVTKVDWTNPHAYLYVDVIGSSGIRTHWTFEMASPNVLERSGMTRGTLSVGERVSLEGYGGFAVANRGVVSSITLPDGRAIFTGPEASDRAPERRTRRSSRSREFGIWSIGLWTRPSISKRIMQFGIKYGF